MMKLTFRAGILVFCLALLVSVSVADESASNESDIKPSQDIENLSDANKPPSLVNEASNESDRSKSAENDSKLSQDIGNHSVANKPPSLVNEASNELDRSKSAENDSTPSQDIGNLSDPNKQPSLVNGASIESDRSKSAENDSKGSQDIGNLSDPNKPPSLVNGASIQSDRSKSADNDNVNTQANLPSHSNGSTNEADRSKQIGDLNDSDRLKAQANETLQTLTLGNSNKTKHISISNPIEEKDKNNEDGSRIDKMKVNVSLRNPEQNVTDDKKYWNVWSGSNQLVPRTGLLAAGAVVCILARKVSGDLRMA